MTNNPPHFQTERETKFLWKQEKCNYWLAEQVQNNVVLLTDGCHSSPIGVVKAKKIIEGLGMGMGRKFIMAKIEDVPEIDVKINQESIKKLKPIIDKYKIP